MRERKKSVTGRSASVGSKRSSRADMALGNANGASTMVVGATMQVPPPPVISVVPSDFYVSSSSYDMHVSSASYDMCPPPHMTCMYPPPHMTCMYPVVPSDFCGSF
jgi:hypothetical protein